VRNFPFASCAGISLSDAKLTLYRSGKRVRSGRGDVLFTHTGLSGPGILDFSRWVESGDDVAVSLVKSESTEKFERELLAITAAHGSWTLKTCMAGYKIPQRLLERAFEVLSVSPECRASSLDKKTRALLVGNFFEFPFPVERVGDFKEAMVTRGGVALGHISASSMESRIVPGLYFAGEALDVDGDTGGYNLQFAFSSGVLAAASVNRSLRKN
jgi:predicted Rossmann fold flavoprotein